MVLQIREACIPFDKSKLVKLRLVEFRLDNSSIKVLRSDSQPPELAKGRAQTVCASQWPADEIFILYDGSSSPRTDDPSTDQITCQIGEERRVKASPEQTTAYYNYKFIFI